MGPKKFVAKLKLDILLFLNENKMVQAAFARNCGKLPENFNVWLNSEAGMNIELFCDSYEQMGGNLQDIFDALHKRQQEKKEKEEEKTKIKRE